MKNSILKYGTMAFMWVAFSLPAMAQPGNPDIDDDPLPEAPIDNWVLGLVLAGIALGAYFLVKYNRKQVA